MGFMEDIKNILGISTEAPLLYRAVIFGDKGVYFENVKSIKSYEKTKIIVCLKNGFITVNGEHMSIKKYCLGDLLITGKITGVNLESEK